MDENNIDCREKILSEDYIDLVLDFPLDEIMNDVGENYDYCYQEVDGRVGILSINRNQLPDMSLRLNDYLAIPDLLGLQIDGSRMSDENQADIVQRENKSDMQISNVDRIIGGEIFDPTPLIQSGITGVQDAPLYLTGRGVIVAFADTGINFRNRIFQKEDGSSRILAIWDQTIQDGTPPEGFLYGTEYTREMINRALDAERNGEVTTALSIISSVDEDGHGTRLAAAAAGSRVEEGSVYNSPAYAADIVVVKLKPAKQYLRDYYQIPEGVRAYASNDVMMAIRYLDSFARVFRRPVVFCLGMGTNFRDHEGTGIFSRFLRTIASQRSRIMVIAGGNEGNEAHHYGGRFQSRGGRMDDSKEEAIEIYVSENVDGFLMEIWTSVPVNPSVSIRTPGGEYIDPTSVLFQTNLRYRFVFEKTVISVYNAYIVQGSGDALILLRFENPTPGVWTIGIRDEERIPDARFDAWLPIADFLQEQVYFLRPDPNVTLTTPAYVSDAITVSTYNSADNSIYSDSGRGFDRNRNVKPDLAAPGVNITTVSNRLGDMPVIGTYTGSSLAAAIMSGAAAQFAQWAVVDGNSPYIRSQEVKNYLIRGADRDRNLEYPNEIWGYGRLDLYGTFMNLQR